MNPQVNAIANRLSLRAPQHEALEILAGVCEALPLDKCFVRSGIMVSRTIGRNRITTRSAKRCTYQNPSH